MPTEAAGSAPRRAHTQYVYLMPGSWSSKGLCMQQKGKGRRWREKGRGGEGVGGGRQGKGRRN